MFLNKPVGFGQGNYCAALHKVSSVLEDFNLYETLRNNLKQPKMLLVFVFVRGQLCDVELMAYDVLRFVLYAMKQPFKNKVMCSGVVRRVRLFAHKV